MSDNTRTILFALVLGVVSSALLAGVSLLTGPYRAANERADEVRNILAALDVPTPPRATQADLLGIFDREIKERTLDGMTIYEYVPPAPGGRPDGRPSGVAVPFTGAGLWGPVSGVLALQPDLVTIRGVRFYKQEETPGLGGEISASWFARQFVGKKIESQSGKPGLQVLKPDTPTGPNSVDGISGATMTSSRVETMLSDLAKRLSERRAQYVQ